MMSRFCAGALLILLSGCPPKLPAPPDADNSDLSVPDVTDMGMRDMSATVTDMRARDMRHPADMDNHLPLKMPPNAVPLTQDGGVDYYEMHVKQATQQVLPSGPPTTIWGFDGVWPGPTIHATLGRPVALKIFNDLPVAESITIHNHGHNVQAAFDGHPSMNNIAQGASYIYHYQNTQMGGTAPNLQGAGTYFFHDHQMGLTAPHFYKGVSAFYIIHPQPTSDEAKLNLPSGPQDIPLMIQDRSFNADNSLAYAAAPINGFQGDVLVVNGTPHPFLNVTRQKYRFRLLNASNARRIDVGIAPGSMFQIATDGGLLPSLVSPSRIPLAPAERVDIVIDFAQYKTGDVVTLLNDDPFTPVQPEIIQFRVTGDATDTSSLPSQLNTLYAPLPAETVDRTVIFTRDATGSWQMNMQNYDPAKVEFANIKLNTVEMWTLQNMDSSIPHPFHEHLVQFQIVDICPIATPNCGTVPLVQQQGWKDTVLLPAMTQVRVKMKFYYSGPDAFTAGNYVFHCHNLEHEDMAMMLQQTVSP